MRHEMHASPDAGGAAKAAADFVAEHVRVAVAARNACSFAVSGGSTPWLMFKELTALDVPWERVTIYQVDERLVPIDDPERNLAHLRTALVGVHPRIEAMPVEQDDLDAACAHYERALPERLDLVHLGLGPDGHTASLVPDDPVLEVTDRLVALTGTYQGHRRMTLTFPALARADQLVWLIAGADKRDALGKLLAGDTSIPAARIEAARSVIFADGAAT